MLGNKLYEREIRNLAIRSKAHRSLYSDRSFISDLDIVNELDGHSGCVNALSWSRGGTLLASGSDDQHLNIHSYQPTDSNSQFRLTTTVATGHTQNIFSVKFMPHQNDRVVVTAAGDSEVRVFDLEYAGQAQTASSASNIASQSRRRGRTNIYDGVRYLNDGDTNCRVYRSHADRCKRIVTESSPFLFLTCSEDGEVRQWDLRQPSSAYPSPRGNRYSEMDSQVPPPLISYRRYALDLNTISCSANQPHYIALGGAHLHALLHDRRMTGRDRLQEAGKLLSPGVSMSADEEELMQQATQCVRKFAPKGQRKMKRTENGHITACKISDARPDEMIVSWSGDHIYSFDLVRSPDAGEEDSASGLQTGSSSKSKESRDRKRKRRENASSTSLRQDAAARVPPEARSDAESGTQTSLRVRYLNGQSEDILLPAHGSRSAPLTSQQQDAQQIARATVRIRASLFAQSTAGQYSNALGQAASVLVDIDEALREWRYPLNPSGEMVSTQQNLRKNRESTRRFVQGSGTLARVLGGELRTPSGHSPMLASFTSVEPRSNDSQPTTKEQFGYDFFKAILLWLESGIGRVVEGFTRPADMVRTSRAASRLPIPESEACVEAIDEFLVRYLYELASDKPVINLDVNQFEIDERRQVFPSEKAAVLAFSAALKIPFADLSSAVSMDGNDHIDAQDRQAARNFWGQKVSRAILFNAAEAVDFTFVDRAFGGLGQVVRDMAAEEQTLQPTGEDDEESIRSVEVLDSDGQVLDGADAEDIALTARNDDDEYPRTIALDEDDDYEELDDDFGEDVEDDYSENDESSEPDEEDGVPNLGLPRFVYRSAFERRRIREGVEVDVPCSAYTRAYRGHLNIKTVKDVNYFGLDDEYVVSGSDDGNVFVWDRKTSELVNVLEGDGEVVNVITGHPYEPMMAVSGIDHTIKIFSPDARARQAARLGHGVVARDATNFSSLAWPNRLGRLPRRGTMRTSSASEPAVAPQLNVEEDDEYVAPTGLASRKKMHDAYQITSQNDVERQGGNQDALITVSFHFIAVPSLSSSRPSFLQTHSSATTGSATYTSATVIRRHGSWGCVLRSA